MPSGGEVVAIVRRLFSARSLASYNGVVMDRKPHEMATKSCILCNRKRNSEGTPRISFHAFPEDEEYRKKWLDAIGKAEIPVHSYLCSRHFPPSYFVSSTLKDDAIPALELGPTSDAEQNRSQQPRTKLSLSSAQVARPIIRRPRTRMLPDEEIQKMQPVKYVRYLKSVNWDEIAKVPSEAKIAWEVAMEELKEGYDKIKHLQAHVSHLKTTARKLETVLKARTKRTVASSQIS
ncbi:PREDICTED: uncharacterized protein LOC106751915 [Dinoponera quadriceps]|uniref:Uncharacterized protein LOC106751915 n=1 Tax=Dinoponera quadriceps TaxID=609295 RepID=A0A6P3YC68_DINQU|nr:PREDICTED: uncharacterized protein LOC106751915 [Dinoponera quadriceps]